jgi:chromosomal replication initiator protein
VIQDRTLEVGIDDVSVILGKTRQTPTLTRPDSIISAICDFYSLKPTQLKGAKRDAALVGPRHVCMFLLKEVADLTFVEIGNLLGGRDHTTVIHGVEKIRDRLSTSEKTREEILFIKQKIKERYLQ